MSESNWRKLSRVDVSHGVEVKHGGLSYLSWSVAWASLMDHFPTATYEWLEPIILPNETVMVRVTVTLSPSVTVSSMAFSATAALPVVDPCT